MGNALPKTCAKKWYRHWYVWVLRLIGLTVLIRLTVLAPREIDIVIGHDTTRITGPLKADGTVDYVAYLNEKCSQGVTRDNNAAVLLIQAFGPDEFFPDSIRQRCMDMLEYEPAPEGAKPFVKFGDYADEHDPPTAIGGFLSPTTRPATQATIAAKPRKRWQAREAAQERLQKRRERMTAALQAPFTAVERPMIAGWVEANAEPLAVIVKASRRPRCYFPLLLENSQKTLADVVLPSVSLYRGAAKALAVRAMMKTAAGDVEGAWGDIVSVHRLARLVNQGPTLIHRLVGIVVEGIGASATVALATSGKLTRAQAVRCLSDLQSLPKLRGVIDVVDEAERFVTLDLIHAQKRGHGTGGEGFPGEAGRAIEASLMDWNIVLQIYNESADRWVAALAVESPVARAHALQVEEDRLMGQPRWRIAVTSIWKRILGRPGQAYASRLMGEFLASILLPPRSTFLYDAVTMHFELSKIALALAAFKADHGAYPAKLSELKGEGYKGCLKSIPPDVFDPSGGLPVYRRTADGYVLYSLGSNMKDDGGEESDSYDDGDIVVRAGKADLTESLQAK